MSSENVIEITDANFEEQVANSPVPVLVDFWAEWCMPCRMLAPIIEELAADYGDKLRVGKLNTDEARDTAMKFGITAIPTVVLLKDGKVAKKFVGLKSKADMKAEIDLALE